MRTMRCRTMLAAVAAPLLAATVATEAAAQARPTRRQAPIEIRGQVPTPQVVTVRPREVPAFSRQVLVPNFYDHDFWPVILPGYQIVSRRLIAGNTRLDSAMTRMVADSAQRAERVRAQAAIGNGFMAPPRAATPMDTTRRQMPATPARMPADSVRPAGGTPPATR